MPPLDREMAVLGNPVQDLAWFNYLDATFPEGPGRDRLTWAAVPIARSRSDP